MRTRTHKSLSRPRCGLHTIVILLVGAGFALGATDEAAHVAPHYATAVAFDVSPPAHDMARRMSTTVLQAVPGNLEPIEIRPDWGPVMEDTGYSGDQALQKDGAGVPLLKEIPAPLSTFEGLSNQDNFDLFGFRVAPPDPVGDVGPNHYVEMINLAVAVYDKTGALMMGPIAIGDLWQGFEIQDCTDPSGDPIVLYDQLEDRWILSQFTTAFTDDMYYNCVAVSETGDPTGPYYRYAFATGDYFPDYPKYGIWRDSVVITTREFGPTVEYQIGVYAVEKNKMYNGEPADHVGVVSFFIDGNDPTLLPLIGDGLLPADIDGKQKPKNAATIPLVGTQDDDAFYGASFDALNIWDLYVQWRSKPIASLTLAAQLPVASFDSIFPCAPTSRDCLPQPGITNPAQYLDVLSYRQRPLHRLAYRNFKDYETLVTNQSVEAMPGIAGVRWYEIRRDEDGYSLYQQGTYAPDDGVHRWMGSIAQDRNGNTAVGYSVVNGVDVYPGIRYTGRLAADPLGEMTLGEGVIVNGSGVQTTTNSRWGDYTSMNIDPIDDCTFWYVNQYYEVSGFPVDPNALTTVPFQTRVGSFKLPGCEAPED